MGLYKISMNLFNETSRTEQVPIHFKNGIEVYMKREDEIHPFVSGNKFRKLKYNIHQANNLGLNSIVSFGGAFSNHIAAVASIGKLAGFETIGVIRGEELEKKWTENPTLSFAVSCGMQLKFVSREVYRRKHEQKVLNGLAIDSSKCLVIPEGGTNALAIKGCEEILTPEDAAYHVICCSVGTGGTISGLINSKFSGQRVLGFPALKGSFLRNEILKFATQSDWQLNSDYHFGGYAKVTDQLVSFINTFKAETGIPLDPIYTGKMMFGICDLNDRDFFPKDSKILAIHTGGLQGIVGMNQRLKQQKRP